MDVRDSIVSQARRACREVQERERKKRELEVEKRKEDRLRTESILQLVRSECKLQRRLETEGFDLPPGSYINIAEALSRENLPENIRKALTGKHESRNMTATSIDLIEDSLESNRFTLSSSSEDYAGLSELKERLLEVFSEYKTEFIRGEDQIEDAFYKASEVIRANNLSGFARGSVAAIKQLKRKDEVGKDEFIKCHMKERSSLTGSVFADVSISRDSSELEESLKFSATNAKGQGRKGKDFTRFGFGTAWKPLKRAYKRCGIDHLAKQRRDAVRNGEVYTATEIDVQIGIAYVRLGKPAALKYLRRAIKQAERECSSPDPKRQSAGERTSSHSQLRQYRTLLGSAYTLVADVCLQKGCQENRDVTDACFEEAAYCVQKWIELPPERCRESRVKSSVRVLQSLRQAMGRGHASERNRILLQNTLGPCNDLLIELLKCMLERDENAMDTRHAALMQTLGDMYVERHEYKEAQEIFTRRSRLVGASSGIIAPVKLTKPIVTLGDRINTLARVSGAVHSKETFGLHLPASTQWPLKWPEKRGGFASNKRALMVPMIKKPKPLAGNDNPSPRSSMRMLLMHPKNKPQTPPTASELDSVRFNERIEGISGMFVPSSSELMYERVDEKLLREDLKCEVDRPKTPRVDVVKNTTNPSITLAEIDEAQWHREQISMFDADVETRIFEKQSHFAEVRDAMNQLHMDMPGCARPSTPPNELSPRRRVKEEMVRIREARSRMSRVLDMPALHDLLTDRNCGV